jgi:hypothetical protein
LPQRPAAARRGPGTDLICLATAGLLWGTGGLTGTLLSRAAGLPALSVAGYRLAAGGALIVAFRTLAGRRWPASRAAWARITTIGLLAAMFQSCYFLAVSLTSVSLATLVTIGSSPVLVLAAERCCGSAGPAAGPAWPPPWPWLAWACWSAPRRAGFRRPRWRPAPAWPWRPQPASLR